MIPYFIFVVFRINNYYSVAFTSWYDFDIWISTYVLNCIPLLFSYMICGMLRNLVTLQTWWRITDISSLLISFMLLVVVSIGAIKSATLSRSFGREYLRPFFNTASSSQLSNVSLIFTIHFFVSLVCFAFLLSCNRNPSNFATSRCFKFCR